MCVYLDDIATSDWDDKEEHLHNLDKVLSRLESAGVHLNCNKLCFYASCKVLGSQNIYTVLATNPREDPGNPQHSSPNQCWKTEILLGLIKLLLYKLLVLIKFVQHLGSL